jgi:hypothetical protein
MPIEIKRSVPIIVLSLMLAYTAYGQEDTVSIKPFERYWTKPRIIPKLGFGVQETPLIEAGIQWHQIYVHPLTLASAGPYFTVDYC